MATKIFLVFDNIWQQQIIKSIIEFYLEKEKITLFGNKHLSSIYHLNHCQLCNEIDRSNYWKLDVLLEEDGITIVAAPQMMLNIIIYWWKQSNGGEKLEIWSDRFLSGLESFDRITQVIIQDLKVIVEDRQGIDRFDLPQLYLSDREQKKIDNLTYKDILLGFDARQFTTEIKGEKIDRPTYHRVRKYVDRINYFYKHFLFI
jgi:hypothetical protein